MVERLSNEAIGLYQDAFSRWGHQIHYMQYGLWLFLIVIMFVINIGWYRRFGIEKGSKIRITELVLFRFCSKDGSVSSSQVIKIKSSTPFRRRWKSPPILNNKVLSKYLFRIGLIFTMSCLLPPWMDPTLELSYYLLNRWAELCGNLVRTRPRQRYRTWSTRCNMYKL